ncbi:MAG: hypothetical protein O7I42_18025 [Alphaproteobacteria bacterium]|nr:hypothetical protein [Alphaproteobacteria bacterium]
MNLSGAETAPNIVEIVIEDNQVRVDLEIYIGDLETFGDLIPDDLLQETAADRPTLDERLRRFASQTLQFITETGETLPAELRLVEPRLRKERFSPFAGMINPQTRQPVPKPPEDKRVLYAQVVYPFSEQPKTLTVVPPVDENGLSMVNIGFIAYHKSVPIIDFRYLSKSATLALDWTDPWYSRFDNPTLKRHHSSALMSFLYVEFDEVRHEVLARIKDLGNWMNLGLRSDEFIEPDEWDGLKDRVGKFLLEKNPVVIDGRAVHPVLARVDFITLGLGGIQLIEEPQRLDISTAILGVILSYAIDGLPKNATVEWELFTGQIRRVPVTVIDPAGPFLSFADRTDRLTEWQNHLKSYSEPTIEAIPLGSGQRLRVPLPALIFLLVAIAAFGLAVKPRLFSRKTWAIAASVGFLGAVLLSSVGVLEVENPLAQPPDQKESIKIVARLAANLHNALREREESGLRDALAPSVSKENLDAILPELRRALAIEIQGGGTARVDRIDDIVVKNVESLGTGGAFRTLAEWSAEASAGHWGHLHQRRIRFNALMELMPVENSWKLIGLTVIDVRQES